MIHRCLFATVMLLGLGARTSPASDPTCCPLAAPSLTLKGLVRMDRCELEALYRQAEPGPVPCGATSGRAIMNPGSRLTVPASQVTRLLWQGKVFRDDGIMINRVFGIRAVKARIYAGESWLDGRPAIVLDYCGMSRLFPNVRDEMREVEPGLYVGITYFRRDEGPKLATFFAIDARR
jgi:hypothetical protein